MSGNSIRFYLDGSEYESPDGWKDTSVEISLDHDSQIISIDYTTEYTWRGDAFAYLYAKMINNTCDLVDVRIDVNCEGVVNSIYGVIFIQSLTANETTASITGKVEDDGFSARIQNNKSTEVSLVSPVSKNGVAISVPASQISVFKPSDGTYYPDNLFCYSAFDCFEFLIKWMTDDNVAFKSDHFTNTNRYISSTENLRTLGENVLPPEFSFKQLYNSLRVLDNLGMGFQRINGVPTVVIENIAYFRNSSNAIIIDDVHTTELSFIQDLLYGRVEIGSEITEPFRCDSGNTQCNASNNILWYGFDKEVYPITGECNRDTAINLSVDSKFIIDTSTIQDIVEYGNEGYNDKVVIITTYAFPSITATQDDPLSLGQNWYNAQFTNKNIVARYIDYLTGSIFTYAISTEINQFNVLKSGNAYQVFTVQSPAWVTSPTIVFATETPLPQFDQDGKYDNTTGIYQPNNEGVYKFNIDGQWQSFSGTTVAGNTITGQPFIEQYDSSGVLLTTHYFNSFSAVTNFGVTVFDEESDFISMDADDYLVIKIRATQTLPVGTHPAEIAFSNIVWKTTDVRAIVRDGQTNTGEQATRKRTATVYNMPISDVFSYLNDTTKNIRIDNQYIDQRSGHSERVKMNVYTGESEITLIHD